MSELIAICGGGGKTTITNKFPSIFLDIDAFPCLSCEALHGVIRCNLPDNNLHSTRHNLSPYAPLHEVWRRGDPTDFAALFL